mmetsp:Transcript_13791/g.55186  ORF Transcript_13791/g.55186 Transcript_13791/m.55186 type:complete len:165 (+) Transcript_13791:79-573(+)
MSSSTRGAYLTFDPASQGTLFVHWSETAVDGALAFFEPRKSVPAFKFKQNAGRSELIREMSGGTGERIKRYYSGWCQFVKLAKSFDGCLTMHSYDVVPRCDVYLLDGSKDEDNVVRVDADAPLVLAPYAVCGAVPHPNPCYAATTMSPAYFTSVGNREGVALAI